MSNGKPTQNGPYRVEVEEGKSYFWCSCGLSASQPFCDGSHKGSEFTPQKHVAEKTGMVALCGCRASGRLPMCDGSHRNIATAEGE